MTFSDNYKGPFFDIYDEEWTDEERKVLEAWIEGRRWVTRTKVEQIIEQMQQRKHAKMQAKFERLANAGSDTDDEDEWEEVFEYFDQYKEKAEFKRKRQFWFDLTPRGIDLDCRREGTRLLVQCKQYSFPVGVQVVREMAGLAAVEHAQATVIGLNGFTEEAVNFANRAKVTLLTVEDLMRMA